MKNLIFLIAYLVTNYSSAAVPTSIDAEIIHGQKGFRNYVNNPTCRKNAVSGITASGGTLVKNTSAALDDISDCKWDPSTSGQTLTWAVKSFAKGLLGQNCEARILYSGDASLVKAYIKQGSTQITPDLTLSNSSSNSIVASIKYPCGDNGSATTIVLESTGNAANVQYSTYTGEMTNQGDVAQRRFLGTLTYAPAASCRWSHSTGLVWTSYSADTDCSSPTVTGEVTATATKIPGFVLPNVAPGRLFIIAHGFFYQAASNGEAGWRLYDGTNGFGETFGYLSGHVGGPLVGTVEYTSPQTNLTIQIQGGLTNTPIDIINTVFPMSLKFEVWWEPSVSQQAVRIENSNYDWTPYTPSSYQGIGTPTNVSFYHKRQGSDLLIRGYLTLGTTAGSEMRIDLPSGLTTSSTLPTLQIVGTGAFNSVGADHYDVVLAEASKSYLTFGVQYSNSLAALSKTNGNFYANGGTYAFTARVPIQGWTENQNAPLLVGGVTSSYMGLTRTEYVSFGGATPQTTYCTSSPCTLWVSTPAVSSVTRTSTGLYVANFTAGTWSAVPVCSVSPVANTSDTYIPEVDRSNTTTAVSFRLKSTGETPTDGSANVICTGPR